jgi:hypothetical protein
MDLSGCGVSGLLPLFGGLPTRIARSYSFSIRTLFAEISLHREAVSWKFPEEHLSKPGC